MSERRTTVTLLPSGEKAEAVEVQVEESTERWSDFQLQDGTMLRAKATILSAARVEGQYDQLGNPMYQINIAPVITIVNVPDRLRKKVQ
jgi:hypothetical protein